MTNTLAEVLPVFRYQEEANKAYTGSPAISQAGMGINLDKPWGVLVGAME
jgi:hypothetical protein